MNLLEALPVILRNMRNPFECDCGASELPNDLKTYYSFENIEHAWEELDELLPKLEC